MAHWLVEKPVSAKEYSREAGQDAVASAWEGSPAIVGVGYHLASLEAVAAAMQIIKDKKLKIMSTQAHYNMAYEFAVCCYATFSSVMKLSFSFTFSKNLLGGTRPFRVDVSSAYAMLRKVESRSNYASPQQLSSKLLT